MDTMNTGEMEMISRNETGLVSVSIRENIWHFPYRRDETAQEAH